MFSASMFFSEKNQVQCYTACVYVLQLLSRAPKGHYKPSSARLNPMHLQVERDQEILFKDGETQSQEKKHLLKVKRWL